MEAGRRKPAAAAMVLTLLLILLVASSACGAVAAARLQGEAGGGHGHRGRVAESIPAAAEGKGPGRSNCTHDPRKPKFGPCPPE
ncbi:hypothetical protein BS78_02G191600 [Paspalum vaginatum]|nr:hypothetical protein BS78_02G191600 [Paspalum vaginatum]